MENKGPVVMDISEVMRILPHRFPFLLVDRVVEHEPGKRIVGLKNVTINEAIEVAKKFGTEDSPSFVNGILDEIATGLTGKI